MVSQPPELWRFYLGIPLHIGSPFAAKTMPEAPSYPSRTDVPLRPSAHEMEDDHDDRDHQQQVDESPGDVNEQANGPENDEKDAD
jgi:hypothetical protein